MTSPAPSIEALEAEARYQRERYALYRARAYGSRATTAAKLRELARAAEGAEARLRQARQDRVVQSGE